MIPYFKPPSLDVGIGTIHAFGVIVACAFLLGLWQASKRAESVGLSYNRVMDWGTWLFVGAFVMAHFVHLGAYHPEEVEKDPWVILKVWQGLSSFGGFIGAFIVFVYYFKRYREPLLAYADAIVWAFPMAWAIGRLGCFVAYDHKGAETDFFLGMATSTGEVRHNLGLYEALFSFALWGVYALLSRRKWPVGFFAALFPMAYAPVRFGLDFLRARDLSYVDRRLFGLTPAQYGCIALFGCGVWLLVYSYRRAAAEA